MNTLGAEGEAAAERYLRAAGCKVVARGYRRPFGEIDIIAFDKGTLLFVEVKTRSSFGFGGPAAAVGKKKQERITAAALAYIKDENPRYDAVRFDVIAIIAGRPPEHIKNAFAPERFTC